MPGPRWWLPITGMSCGSAGGYGWDISWTPMPFGTCDNWDSEVESGPSGVVTPTCDAGGLTTREGWKVLYRGFHTYVQVSEGSRSVFVSTQSERFVDLLSVSSWLTLQQLCLLRWAGQLWRPCQQAQSSSLPQHTKGRKEAQDCSASVPGFLLRDEDEFDKTTTSPSSDVFIEGEVSGASQEQDPKETTWEKPNLNSCDLNERPTTLCHVAPSWSPGGGSVCMLHPILSLWHMYCWSLIW